MNEEVRARFERQAAWQRKEKDLPWPEKIKQAEFLKDSALKLRAARLVVDLDTAPEDRRQT